MQHANGDQECHGIFMEPEQKGCLPKTQPGRQPDGRQQLESFEFETIALSHTGILGLLRTEGLGSRYAKSFSVAHPSAMRARASVGAGS